MSNELGASKSQFLFADYVRVLATLAVIALHSSGELLNNYNEVAKNDWWIGNIINSSLRWSVPLFVMLSGALLLEGKKEGNRNFLKKRAGRVLIPYLFWSCIYVIYVYRYDFRDGLPLKYDEIWYKLAFNDGHYHLWFVSMILGLYLLTPTLRILCANGTQKDLEYFITVWFFSVTICTYYPKFFVIKFMGWMAYVGLFVAGHYLKKYGFKFQKYLYAAGWIAFFITPLGTYYLTNRKGEFDGQFQTYLAPNILACSFALFLYLKNYDWQNLEANFPRVARFIHRFASMSFGVYLLHALILDILKNGYFGFAIYNNNILGVPTNPCYAVPILTTFVTVISTIIIALLYKIPHAKKLVG